MLTKKGAKILLKKPISFITHEVTFKGSWMFKSTLLLTLFCATQAFSQAEKDVIKTCELKEVMNLKTDTVIYCEGDLHTQKNAKIITNSHSLNILVTGKVFFSSKEDGGFQIVSSETKNEKASGPIHVEAKTAVGFLNIDNTGSVGGDVELNFVTIHDYAQSVSPGPSASVNLIIDGQLIVISSVNDSKEMDKEDKNLP